MHCVPTFIARYSDADICTILFVADPTEYAGGMRFRSESHARMAHKWA